jgi:hypothetical protein
VVMKKSRCPGSSPGCGDGELKMDVAIPGFADGKQGNVCGNPGTTLSKQQSDVCRGATPEHCNCSLIPGDTAASRRMREGCELFKAWGWQSSNPTLDWRPVDCPPRFVERVRLGEAFGPSGPTTVTFYNESMGGSNSVPVPPGKMHVAVTAGVMALCLPVLFAVIGGRRLLAMQRRQPHHVAEDQESLMPVQ